VITAVVTFVLVCTVVIAWFAGRALNRTLFPPEIIGLSYLKRRLKARGVDATRIPQSALSEIVVQDLFTVRTLSSIDIEPSHKNWRRKFDEYLDMEAAAIASILAGDRGEEIRALVAWKVLLAHGIVSEDD
jgi:hypothetical protein